MKAPPPGVVYGRGQPPSFGGGSAGVVVFGFAAVGVAAAGLAGGFVVCVAGWAAGVAGFAGVVAGGVWVLASNAGAIGCTVAQIIATTASAERAADRRYTIFMSSSPRARN